MMGLTWYFLGFLSTASLLLFWRLSKQYRLNWMAWSLLISGTVLVLFAIAWSVGAVLEGVPRAGSMGMLLFGLPGIICLTLGMRYVTTRLDKRTAMTETQGVKPAEAPAPAEITPPQMARKPALKVPPFIRFGAYSSLAAAFLLGIASGDTDYEAMVQRQVTDKVLTKVNDNPVVFQLGEKVDGKGEYVLIQEGQGYGGPFVLGIRIHDDAQIAAVLPLDDRETPAFLERVKQANYLDQYINKAITDNFIVGDDIDAVSGATVTTMAATQAVRESSHIAALQYFKLEPGWTSVPWKFGLGEILIIVLFGLAFVPKVSQKKPWKYGYMAACVTIVGFYLNASISVGSLSAMLMGFVPGISEHIGWWVLVIGTVATILISGKNIYCYRICPFFGVEFFLSKISGMRTTPSPTLARNAKFVANSLLWLALMVIFLSRHPALGSYEPFAMMFSLEGIGIQWYILPLALIGSFFMSTFWCRFFCPAGNMLAHLVKLRKFVIKGQAPKN
jgi:polyferredoxin/Na+-translocating ferredoxin:NAD+ oxidoreductase RnfG subunit